MRVLETSYVEPVFRPPSEAQSLIFQVTNGCSWNKCTFCEMYTAQQKKFQVKPENDVLAEIKIAAELYPRTQRVFLADGDALVLSTRRLLTILSAIKQHFQNVRRVSAYCLPRNIKNKSADEIAELHAAGLKMLYVGAESGDDTVLKHVNKGETFASTLDALLKIRSTNIVQSVIILNGVGGKQYTKQHAANSALLINEAQPEYLATLVVSFPLGDQRFLSGYNHEFEALSQPGLFHEVYSFIEKLDLDRTVFRSDHASNYLVLRGTLGRDKAQLLNQIKMAMDFPEQAHLRQEWQRGL